MSRKLEILKFFRDHLNQEFSAKELAKEFDMSQPAMWKNIRELWVGNWIVKTNTSIPQKYTFNELLLIFNN